MNVRTTRPLALRWLAFRWLAGAVIGTLLIAVTSPLFVRSYLRHEIDSIRGVRVMPTGSTYRWRSEGYANTHIGPHGMPGKASIGDPRVASMRIALWGDSQAEGVCVADDQKLFARIEQLSGGDLEVLPFARSGDDATDWLRQIPGVEQAFDIDLHAVLIVDLPDLLMDPDRVHESDDVGLITTLPAFVIQGARNLIIDADSGERRQLRWSIGPVTSPVTGRVDRAARSRDWEASIAKWDASTARPILLIYAPQAPQIVAGTLKFDDPAAEDFATVQRAAQQRGITVIHLHEALCASAREGHWPHGFHNGQFGVGHFNARGYDVIANSLTASIARRP